MWQDKFTESIESEIKELAQYDVFYSAFSVSAKRLAKSSATIDPEFVDGLRRRNKDLEHKLAKSTQQLNAAQQRARDMVEEQYMKTHAVQDLHDEILALTMQLNVSEEKQRDLEQENTQLVQRWVNKVKQDAGTD